MKIAIYTHPDCLRHNTGLHHPECAGRIIRIMEQLKLCSFSNQLELLDAPLGLDKEILLAHSKDYLKYIQNAAPTKRTIMLDGDTIMSSDTLDAALRAVGAGRGAVDDIMNHKYNVAFCANRPPGHHATKNKAMGFCIFNNIAIAAFYALQKYKLKRVAIVDFDVHHGNGTEDIVKNEKGIIYISTHESPLFPYTGESKKPVAENIVNIPFPAGTDGNQYREIFNNEVLTKLEEFKPELLLVSAGFDAHSEDPLANINLADDDYYWIGQQLSEIAHKYCNGKVISFLEGGYNLDVLGESVTSYLNAYINYSNNDVVQKSHSIVYQSK